jgi:predicted secreted protein
MNGVFLVNGEPPMINVDDYKYLSQDSLDKNADYAALKRKYPNVSIWPGDRYHKELPTEGSSANGGQDFVVEYLLQDGCHACARLGTARLKFEFDSSGEFQKVETVSVAGLAVTPGKAKASPSREPGVMYVRMGKSFPVTLIANHTTGYSWRLANESEVAATVKRIGATFRESFPGNAGSGGEEIWTFEPVAKGSVELDFEYVRPFEPNAVPVKTLNLRVTVD